jgi:hypothetical protein
METQNNCQLRAVEVYVCGSRVGCKYFTLDVWKNPRKGDCRYYQWRTGECTSGMAKAEAAAAAAAAEAGDGGEASACQ